MAFALAYPNRFDTLSTLSGQGWTSTLPVSYLTTRQISQVARSHWKASKFFANFSAAIDAQTFAGIGHNLSTTGQFRVRGYTTETRPQIDRSTQVSVCDIDLAGGFPASSVSCARASAGTYFDSDLVLQTAANNAPRFTHDPNTGAALGLLIESTVTNMLLWSRDFTNAAWTKTNMTTAQTATGADGVANSATQLTATAGNATVTQTVTIAGNAYASVLARRVSGTGTVQLSGDNFSTTTNMVLTSNWKRFWIACGTGTETFGVKIVTSGDVIELDFAQFEGGSSVSSGVTSPIATNGSIAQRVADAISIFIPSNLRPSSASGSWVAEARFFGRSTSAMTFLTIGGSTSVTLQHDASGNLEYAYGGTAARRFAAVTVDSDFTLAVNYANTSHDARYNATTTATLANPATTAGTFTSVSAGAAYAGFAMRRLTFFSAVQDSGTLTTFATAFTPPSPGYDSGWVDGWPADWVAGTTAEERDGVRGAATLYAASTQTYAYWRFDLSDADNPDGYIQLGRVFIGSSWQPDYGLLSGASIGYESRSTSVEADGGAEYHQTRRSPLVVRFNLEAQTQEAAMRKILEMQRQLGTTGELLFTWDTGDTLYQPARTFLGRLRSLSPLTAINSNLWSAAFEVKELL